MTLYAYAMQGKTYFNVRKLESIYLTSTLYVRRKFRFKVMYIVVHTALCLELKVRC